MSLLTVADTARRLACTEEHVRTLIRRGDLRTVDIGSGRRRPTLRLIEEEVVAWLRMRTARPKWHERERGET